MVNVVFESDNWIDIPDGVVEHFVAPSPLFTSFFASGGAVNHLQQLGYYDEDNLVRKSRKGLSWVSISNAASSRVVQCLNSAGIPRMYINGSSLGNKCSFFISADIAITTIPDAVNDPCYLGFGLLDILTSYPIGSTAKGVAIRAPFSNESKVYKISILQSGVETVIDTTINYSGTATSNPKFINVFFGFNAKTAELTIVINNGSVYDKLILDLDSLYAGALSANHRAGCFLFRNGTTAAAVSRSIYMDKFIYQFEKNY